MPENSNSSTGKMLGAWFALLLLLGFCAFGNDGSESGTGDDEEVSRYALAPCSAENSIFAVLPYEQWADHYHGTVNEIVNAQIRQLQQRDASVALQCASDDFADVLPATTDLETLARTLPPWAPRPSAGFVFGTTELPHVSATDMVPVLMEFLRIYECSLLERQYEGVIVFNASSSSSSSAPTEDSSSSTALSYPDFAEQEDIREELATARPALERTMVLMSGMDRLQPLVAELSCLERSLTDIRNITGLLAEQSSCWNRTWDARGSLRDLPQ